MNDSFKRNINYLRISVTDRCDLRCIYCMPECGVEKFEHAKILSVEEIETIVNEAVKLGITKIRLTGGEPLVKKGLIDICRNISKHPEIKELCITTNGMLLKDFAKDLKDAGVTRFNISLDTLDNEKFKKITRCKMYDKPVDRIFEGIELAESLGFKNFKFNTVLLGGINDDEISDFIEMTKDKDYCFRFIELMPIGEAMNWDKEAFITNDDVLERFPELEFVEDGNVSKIYRKPGYKGTIGLISPMSHRFCSECNRMRLTSDGKLKACLHSKKETLIKGLSSEEIYEAIKKEIENKPENYKLGLDNFSDSERSMSQIGG